MKEILFLEVSEELNDLLKILHQKMINTKLHSETLGLKTHIGDIEVLSEWAGPIQANVIDRNGVVETKEIPAGNYISYNNRYFTNIKGLLIYIDEYHDLYEDVFLDSIESLFECLRESISYTKKTEYRYRYLLQEMKDFKEGLPAIEPRKVLTEKTN